MTIRRNAYGRQNDSMILETSSALGDKPLEMVFIRAPRIERVGGDVEEDAGEAWGLSRPGAAGKCDGSNLPSRVIEQTRERVHAEFLKLVKNGTSTNSTK